MKKITILLVIIFTFLFSTTSWGDWSYVDTTIDGFKFYYDKDRVRKSGKYIYFWELFDSPSRKEGVSMIKYIELDCSIFRYKKLIFQVWTEYNKTIGEGNKIKEFTPDDKWGYPKPESSLEYVYNKICEEQQ